MENSTLFELKLWSLDYFLRKHHANQTQLLIGNRALKKILPANFHFKNIGISLRDESVVLDKVLVVVGTVTYEDLLPFLIVLIGFHHIVFCIFIIVEKVIDVTLVHSLRVVSHVVQRDEDPHF